MLLQCRAYSLKSRLLSCHKYNVYGKDAAYVCMIARAFVWTSVHLCLPTERRKKGKRETEGGREREGGGMYFLIDMFP